MKTVKRTMTALCLTALLCCLLCVSAYATGTSGGTGDVASAVESTWATASGQIKTVVDNVVFPAIDLILAVFFFIKDFFPDMVAAGLAPVKALFELIQIVLARADAAA